MCSRTSSSIAQTRPNCAQLHDLHVLHQYATVLCDRGARICHPVPLLHVKGSFLSLSMALLLMLQLWQVELHQLGLHGGPSVLP